MSLSNRIAASLRAHQDRVGLVCDGQDYRWSYVSKMAFDLNEAFRKHAVDPSADVALIARNRPGQVACFIANLSAGRCTRMIHPLQQSEQIAADIRDQKYQVIAADETQWNEVILAAAKEVNALGIKVREHRDMPTQIVCVPTREAERHRVVRAGKQNAVETMTSGTTGSPKRILISFEALESTVDDVIRLSEDIGDICDPAIPIVEYMPLAAVGGAYTCALAGATGRTYVISEKFSAADFSAAIKTHRPRIVGLNPALMRDLLNSGLPVSDLQSLVAVRSGTARLDQETRERWSSTYGIPIIHVYGATEFFGPVTSWSMSEYEKYRNTSKVSESSGRARPGMKLRIIDRDTQQQLPPGDAGILEVLVPRVGPDWMRTNDMASLDQEGYLYLYGRADDAINRGGHKIIPEVIERVLRSHPSVADAAAIGISDSRLGEVPVAAVELKDGSVPVTEAGLKEFARSRLLAYQVPVEVRLVGRLPRNLQLKVSRQSLRSLFAVRQ